MNEPFQGYVVKAQIGTNMNSDMCQSLNKVVVRKCDEFYANRQKHRNKTCHDAERQEKRIKSQLKKEARNSTNLQTRECVKKFAIDEERSDIEKMKKWTLNLKKMKMKLE